MSLGMSAAWTKMQPKKKRCKRCGLYYTKTLSQCDHCSQFDDSQLVTFKKQHQETLKGNSALGKTMFLCAVIIGLFLIASF
ncbi:hypothetical protein [Thalassomonas sp. M1454]|uniref:hypothetical protein n=1 Tax=Thalassomonas sp. M1454 TaxID=2594477 RepID=UPI0011805278|nr:hypothetical protein [Thalassomonas sp. M1454]TRX56840.1 hypothetical protein FNN08_04790 [Thalassomonas sp. M1454]